MINVDQLRREIVAPALKHIQLWSPAAEELLLGTAAVESRMGTYLRQVGGGPALGIWQVEPATHADTWINWLQYRQPVGEVLLDLVPPLYRNFGETIAVDPQALVACPMYCCAIARIKYRRSPEPLPAAGDWAGLELYHKRHYNSILGATKSGDFIAACRACGLV